MKTKVFLIMLISSALLFSCAKAGNEEKSGTDELWGTSEGAQRLQITSVETMYPEMRGVWIATVHNINFPSAPDRSAKQLAAELDEIVALCARLGLNTIFFQAHPSSDALYSSELFPLSRFLTTKDTLYFDPLEYITNECHKAQIRLFAWINPFRVSTDTYESKEAAIESQTTQGGNTELMVYYNDGRLYYDPGAPEVTTLISDCVAEIVSTYDVDGIVFDDYFYPYPCGDAPFDDADTYAASAHEMPLDDWRRDNINRIIRTCYTRIKELKATCLFGVAPFGVWQNSDGNNEGSATRALQAYSSLYCDALAWAEGGYVDFISPQIYWNNDESAAPFDVLCEWWDNALRNTGVEFVPSLAAYKYEGAWDKPSGEMRRQISLCRRFSTYRGAVYYGFEAIRSDAERITEEISSLNRELYLYNRALRYPGDLRKVCRMTGTVFEMKKVDIQGISPKDSSLSVNDYAVKADRWGKFAFTALLFPGENIISLQSGAESKVLRMFIQ